MAAAAPANASSFLAGWRRARAAGHRFITAPQYREIPAVQAKKCNIAVIACIRPFTVTAAVAVDQVTKEKFHLYAPFVKTRRRGAVAPAVDRAGRLPRDTGIPHQRH
jgi:hypothetical protein